MQRERLTLDRIRRFTCPDGVKQVFLWDSVAPRLAVRATTGAKSFIFEAKLNRKTIRRTIGDANVWNLEQARAEANRLQVLVESGTDPRELDRQKEEAKEAAKVAAEAAAREAERRAAPAIEAWAAYVTARRSKWGALTLRDHERVSQEGGQPITRGKKATEDGTTQPGALRALLLRPLAEIDAVAVHAWLQAEAAKRPTHAALAFRLLRGFLNWCAEQPELANQVQAGACAGRKVREELPKRAAKDDCLQREQLKPWFAKVRAIKNPAIAAYLQAALLTGARREELAALRWEDVDFQWAALRIRDKVEGERVIPLTPYVAQLLRDLKRRNDTPPAEWRILHGKKVRNDLESWEPAPWVFSSPTAAAGYLQEPRIQHKKACDEAGIDGLTIHGLRRSFGTLAEWCEVPTGVVAQIMGHKPSATAEKHYRRRPLDLLRQWHTKIEAWILAEAGVEQPAAGEAPALVAVGAGK
ncbi:MAG: integrase family protein [Thauera sp.]|uniref:integrase family protein n=1 Tax=Thauera sp. TaxID=1905334 RepID=UPI001DAB5197|nr:integrase family protein [Thauera sp.]MCB1945736.1 integrase family protein [Thauera sp.]MCP5224547.1 integrase family protein [Thauera sp.]